MGGGGVLSGEVNNLLFDVGSDIFRQSFRIREEGVEAFGERGAEGGGIDELRDLIRDEGGDVGGGCCTCQVIGNRLFDGGSRFIH